MTPAALLSLLLAAPFRVGSDELPALRWRPTSERPAPVIELAESQRHVELDGTARRAQLRLACDDAPPGSAGTIVLELLGDAPALDEERSWSSGDGVARTTWSDGNHAFERDLFASAADPLLVVRLRSDGGPLALRIEWSDAEFVAPNRLRIDAGDLDGELRVESVGGRIVAETAAEGDTLRVEGALAIVVRLAFGIGEGGYDGAKALDGVAAMPFQQLLERHLTARAKQRGGFALELGAPDDLARWRGVMTDERLRLLRDGVDDPDLAATWIGLARQRLPDSPRCSSDPPDLAAARAQFERRDGDAAWAALRPRVAMRLVPLLGPRDDERPVDFECSSLLLRLLVDERGEGDAARLALLPALPRTWSDGIVTGARAPSGVVVDLRWSDGALDSARLSSPRDATLRIDAGRGDFELVEVDEKGTLQPPRPAPRARDGGALLELAAKAGRPLVLQRRRE